MNKNSKLLLCLGIACVILITVITVICCVLWRNRYSDTTPEDSIDTDSVVEEVKIPVNESGDKCIPDSYFSHIDDSGYELVYEEELPLTWEEHTYDPKSELPAYQQTLVTYSNKLYQTLEGPVQEYMNDQTFDTESLIKISTTSTEYMAETVYLIELSTEYHYYLCLASRTVDTAEDSANIRIYRKVTVPNVS